MKLKFQSQYKSITEKDKEAIEALELPDFSIITGTNGNGTTHLLGAITNNSIKIEEGGIET